MANGLRRFNLYCSLNINKCHQNRFKWRNWVTKVFTNLLMTNRKSRIYWNWQMILQQKKTDMHKKTKKKQQKYKSKSCWVKLKVTYSCLLTEWGGCVCPWLKNLFWFLTPCWMLVGDAEGLALRGLWNAFTGVNESRSTYWFGNK